MSDRQNLSSRLDAWLAAGLLDSATANRIRAFESSRDSSTLRWPTFIALLFGAILLAAGVTLFVAAHWDALSPSSRFTIVLLLVSVFHVAGAFVSARYPNLSAALHAIGTACLGASIFLAAQIFNLHEDWTTGILLWALGSAAGWLLLRQWPQAFLLALLVPAWLIGEWSVRSEGHRPASDFPLVFFLVLTSFVYLSARIGDDPSPIRRALSALGSVALFPAAILAMIWIRQTVYRESSPSESLLPASTRALFWIVAVAAPLLFAFLLRRRRALWDLAFAVWTFAFLTACKHMEVLRPTRLHLSFPWTLAVYLLLAVGSAGMVLWGLAEKRKERLNLGVAAFALSVLFFYFDSFMSKLGRSFSLLVLGLLCILGGYFLERTRRRLVRRLESVP